MQNVSYQICWLLGLKRGLFGYCYFFFFFQAEDGIRDLIVTGVQTCALPIYAMAGSWNAEIVPGLAPEPGDIVLGKQTYSPFLNPAFERTLAERGLTRLYITGDRKSVV